MSDPGPSMSPTRYTLTPKWETAPAPLLPGVVSRGMLGHKPKMCRRCRETKPAYTFILLHAPQAKSWATRSWCGDCLVADGQARARHLADAIRLEEPPPPFEPVVLTREQRDRVAHRIQVSWHYSTLPWKTVHSLTRFSAHPSSWSPRGGRMSSPSEREDLSAQRAAVADARKNLAGALAHLSEDAARAFRAARTKAGLPDLPAVYAASRAVERAEAVLDMATYDLSTASGEHG